MKNFFFKSLIVFAFATVLFQSCKEEDTTPPVITLVSVNDTMGDDFEVAPGDSLVVRFNVSDDNKLSQLNASIHEAADGHGHEGESDTASVPNVGLWVDSRILPLSGSSQQMELFYVVPEAIQGVWHLELQAIDDSGNAAEEFVVEFDVE